MVNRFKIIEGSVVAPIGFKASGVFCDIKRLGTGKGSEKGQKRDLAIIFSEVPAKVAGMFTTNQVCAAPVKLCIDRVKKGIARAIVANSGNANACTGRQGMQDALQMAEFTASLLSIPPQQVLVASTGRIGVFLPMENVKNGIRMAIPLLGNSVECADNAAEAIMTSDTRQKKIAVEIKVAGKAVRIGGICKGAGMIHPGMSATGKRPPAMAHATMLCFLTTDVEIDQKTLQSALEEAVAESFNRITVDGDMSTNDTVLILANGLARNPKLSRSSRDPLVVKGLKAFTEALKFVCLELAKMIVLDGEGVTKFVTIYVNGARSNKEADYAARAVGNSALVKTSWYGGDPNWGRIIDALGYSQATVVEEKVDIGYSLPGNKKIVWSLKRGRPTNVEFSELCRLVAEPQFNLHINLNSGKGRAVLYSADLTEEYVDFNKGNVNDPASLGG